MGKRKNKRPSQSQQQIEEQLPTEETLDKTVEAEPLETNMPPRVSNSSQEDDTLKTEDNSPLESSYQPSIDSVPDTITVDKLQDDDIQEEKLLETPVDDNDSKAEPVILEGTKEIDVEPEEQIQNLVLNVVPVEMPSIIENSSEQEPLTNTQELIVVELTAEQPEKQVSEIVPMETSPAGSQETDKKVCTSLLNKCIIL